MKLRNDLFSWRTVAIATVPVFVLVFSLMALWLGDDITYKYSFKDGTQISSLSDVVTSQIEHYKTVNGRTVAHFLCQLYLPFFGKTAFAVSNTLVWTVLLLLMASLFKVQYDDWKRMALLAFLIILGFRTKFTPTCQIGFPWMFVLVTAFLLILRKYDKENEHRWSAWHLLWAAPFAIIAGWSQEALVIGIGMALGVFILLNIRKVSWKQWILLACFAVGAALLCLSPATLGRTSETHGGSNLLPPAVLSFAKLGFYLRITYLMLAFLLYLRIFRKIKFKELFSNTAFYWIVWVVMLAFNLFIGVYGNRQLFGMEFAAIAIIVRYVQLYILPEKEKYKTAGTIVLAALALWVAVVAVANARFLNHHGKVLDYIDASYKESEDGMVYYDFSAKEVTFKDTYPSDVFTWYALNTLDRSYNSEKHLQVVPTLCAGLKQAVGANGWEKIAPGAIAVIIDKSNPPAGIKVRRTVFGHHLSDMWVGTEEPAFENDSNLVFLVYEKLPFVRHEAVIFE
jgi:hypothetical protein